MALAHLYEGGYENNIIIGAGLSFELGISQYGSLWIWGKPPRESKLKLAITILAYMVLKLMLCHKVFLFMFCFVFLFCVFVLFSFLFVCVF